MADTDGTAVFISTPQGHDWFHHIYMMGQDQLEKDYWSFSAPSTINPYLDHAFIEEMRRTMPEDKFRQEILAVFLANASTVFKRIDGCIRNPEKIIYGNSYQEEPIPGHYYILGWDPAKHHDFSVIIVLDCNTNRLVAFDRDQHTDYRLQIIRVLALAFKYNKAVIVMDATGVGDPLLEQLRESGLTVEGIVWTAPKKREMVERLQLATEHQQIDIPNIVILVSELQAYGYKITSSGAIVYGAPENQDEGIEIHDDCVSSLMMAVHSMSSASGIPVALSGVRSSRTEDKSEERPFDDGHRQANLGRLLQSLGGLR
jgi:Terminase RNaseH-like domain